MRNKLFNYMGAKTKLLPIMFKRFPRGYINMKWVDVFGGSGIVTFAKPRSKVEIFNDYDKGISAIFWHLATDYDRFSHAASNLIYSQGIWEWFKNLDTSNMNRFDLAIRTLYLIHMAFSGGFGNNMIDPPSLKPDNRHVIFDTDLWKLWHQRFRKVFVKCMDFEELIKKYDSPTTFFYCDPPYTIAEDTGYYNIIFDCEAHSRLHDVLSGIEGKVLMSYNNAPDIKKMYCTWNIEKVPLRYQAKRTGTEDTYELLISNFDNKTLLDYF